MQLIKVIELLLLSDVHCFIPRVIAPGSGCVEKLLVMSHAGYFCRVAALFNNALQATSSLRSAAPERGR